MFYMHKIFSIMKLAMSFALSASHRHFQVGNTGLEGVFYTERQQSKKWE